MLIIEYFPYLFAIDNDIISINKMWLDIELSSYQRWPLNEFILKAKKNVQTNWSSKDKFLQH